jgi:hypothetical protein
MGAFARPNQPEPHQRRFRQIVALFEVALQMQLQAAFALVGGRAGPVFHG